VPHDKPQPSPKSTKALALQFCDAFPHLSSSAEHGGHDVGLILAHIRAEAAKIDVKFKYPATVRTSPGNGEKMCVGLIGDAVHATHPALFQVV
jgi:hypothetical protein